jgi:hypothetical protein
MLNSFDLQLKLPNCKPSLKEHHHHIIPLELKCSSSCKIKLFKTLSGRNRARAQGHGKNSCLIGCGAAAGLVGNGSGAATSTSSGVASAAVSSQP